MKSRFLVFAFALLVSTTAHSGSATLKTTDGTILVAHTVESPQMRAETTMATPKIVTLRWAYFGHTATDAPLDSGVLRRQIGLKLQSANPCNLIYVMREVEPESKIFVQVKINAGKKTSTQCGSAGYINIANKDMPVETSGTLKVKFIASTAVGGGTNMEIWDQNTALLIIPLTDDLKKLKGVYGVRSDSGVFVFDIKP